MTRKESRCGIAETGGSIAERSKPCGGPSAWNPLRAPDEELNSGEIRRPVRPAVLLLLLAVWPRESRQQGRAQARRPFASPGAGALRSPRAHPAGDFLPLSQPAERPVSPQPADARLMRSLRKAPFRDVFMLRTFLSLKDGWADGRAGGLGPERLGLARVVPTRSGRQ
ncbi:UNVERIFIED_CONTAM: hypothetical protein K2H54_060832 [Gekko kuhli]